MFCAHTNKQFLNTSRGSENSTEFSHHLPEDSIKFPR